MNITFITGHLCKERHALLNELALDLGEYGAKVTVLTGFPSRRISEEVKQYYLEHPVEQISENVIVRRVGSRGGEGEGLFDRMIKYAKLTWTIYKEAKKTPTDVYYIYSSPFFLGWMGAKLVKKAPTVYNAQDLFPDTLIKIKGYGEGNPMIKFFRMMERWVYRKNTRIITISEEMKRTIMSQKCPADKIDVIYNWADTESLHHVERINNKLMDELDVPKDKFIVSYAGDIGLFQGWPVIVEAAKKAHAQNSDIIFVIIGSGSYKAQLEKQVADEGLDYILIRPLQPASRCAEIYSIGDLELVSIEPGLSKMALPSKTFVIMSAGSAMLSLVDQTSDIAQLIKEKDMGYTLEHGDADALANTILEAYEKRGHLDAQGKNARKFAEENAARKTQTKKYFDILKGLV
ncbi:MAG: glycosyltransferase family 4 protein [Bacteroidales bacterium]|nr:glycosyltransferase family 4 protein [Bacteroidales bacterium]